MKTDEQLIWEAYITESPLSDEFDHVEDEDSWDIDFSHYYDDKPPKKLLGDKIYYGRNVEWIGEKGKTIRVDSEYVSSREDNITDHKKVMAVKNFIKNNEERVRLRTLPADIRIIGEDYIRETQEAHARDALQIEYRITEPFSTGDDVVDKYLYMGSKEFAEYFGLNPDYVNDDGTVNIEEIKDWEDEDDWEDIIEDIQYNFNDVKDRLNYCKEKQTGDLGKLWAVLRDGNHRGWGAILAGEEYIYVYPSTVTNKGLQELKRYLI